MSDSGLMSSDDVRGFLEKLSEDERPGDGDSTAALLIERGGLMDGAARMPQFILTEIHS